MGEGEESEAYKSFQALLKKGITIPNCGIVIYQKGEYLVR